MTSSDEEIRTSAGPSIGLRFWNSSRPYRPVLILLLVLFIGFATTQQYFFTTVNLRSMVLSLAALWIVAIGMTFAVISAGVDLSIGAAVALSGVFLAKMLSAGLPAWLAIVLTMVFGAAVGGIINGLLIASGLSFFVVTLASLTALTGVVSVWTDNNTLTVNDSALSDLASKSIMGVPLIIWLMLVAFLLALFVQQRTRFGRNIFAVGGSISAARMSGIRSGRTIIGVYALLGLCGAIAAIVTTAQLQVASPNVSPSLALTGIAAVLLGGSSLFGGAGSVIGSALGVLFIGVLQNGLNIAGIQSYWQNVATGLILVIAVANTAGISAKVMDLRRRWRARSPLAVSLTGTSANRAATALDPDSRGPVVHR